MIATLNLVIDMLQGAFRVEYGTKFVTVLGQHRVESVRQDLNYVGGYQDHLLRESVAVFPVDKIPISWKQGGATRVKNSNLRLLRKQPGALRWSEDGEERKRFVLYNLSERNFVCQSSKR